MGQDLLVRFLLPSLEELVVKELLRELIFRGDIHD